METVLSPSLRERARVRVRSDHAVLTQRVGVGLSEPEESPVDVVVVGAENRGRFVECRLMGDGAAKGGWVTRS